MVKLACGLRPLVPPMVTSDPLRALSNGQQARCQPHMREKLERKAVLPVCVREFKEIAALGGARRC